MSDRNWDYVSDEEAKSLAVDLERERDEVTARLGEALEVIEELLEYVPPCDPSQPRSAIWCIRHQRKICDADGVRQRAAAVLSHAGPNP